MNAYIEIESLRSLISQNKDDRYYECMRMLKRNLNLNFSFSKEEARADHAIEIWVKELSTGAISEKPKWESDYPNQYDELSLQDMTLEKLCAVYLLDDEEPQHLANAMLVSHFGHELDTLSRLFVKTDTQEFELQQSPRQIANWNSLSEYIAQCSDILLADRYILSKRSMLRKNLYQIINALVKKSRDVCISIVLIVESKSVDTSIDLNDVSDTIKENVKSIVGMAPNVTFMLCSPHEGTPLFHDRLILTNYRAISSGDSFNYFREDGRINTGGFGITISSLAKNCTYVKDQVANTFLLQLGKEIPYALIKGDRKSNFLKFS